jgi:hypothetical protein
MIAKHQLSDTAAVILLLDVWAVHISAEFRSFISEKHSYIKLVYIPPNCTSKLQVADVALNYPFKHGFKRRFNEWAAQVIHDQIQQGDVVGLKALTGMTLIKPKVLEWALDSWKSLSVEKLLIEKGWLICVLAHYDVTNEEQRLAAMRLAVRDPVAPDTVPEEMEEEVDDEGFCAEESDDEAKTEAVIMKERVYGERKSSRRAAPPARSGYMLNSSQLKFS